MSVAWDFIVLFLGSGPSVSVEILFNLPEGFVSGSLVSLDVIVCGLLLGSKKFYKMQARVLHRVHMARGLSQAVSCLVLFPYVASEICELFILAMVCANFIDFGAVFDIKVVGLLVSAVGYQASV